MASSFRRYLTLLLFALICCNIQSNAQTATVTRDPNALALLGSLVQAMGGSAAISSVGTCTATGQFTKLDGTPIGTFEWSAAADTYDINTSSVDGSTTQTYYHADGTFSSVRNGTAAAFGYHQARAVLPLHAIVLIANEALLSPQWDVTNLGNSSFYGRVLLRLSVVDRHDAITAIVRRIDIYVDPQSATIAGFTYLIPDAKDTSKNTSVDVVVGQSQPVLGVLFSREFQHNFDSNSSQLFRIGSITCSRVAGGAQ